ncbi:HAD family hydrolase [Hydrogenimonas sp.]
MSTKAVILDFDGVLFDTVKEAYAVATVAFGKGGGIERIDFEAPLYRVFRKYRYLIAPAWNYLYLLKAIEQCPEERIPLCFEQFLNGAEKKDYAKFETNFFATRRQFIQNDYKKWLSLNEPTPFVYDIGTMIQKHPQQWYIVTTKDRYTVLKLLETVDIPFPAERIFDKEDFSQKDKGEIISDIMKNNKIEKALFIDDSRKHLNACSQISGLDLMQPDWGYHKPGDEVLNRQQILSGIHSFIGDT